MVLLLLSLRFTPPEVTLFESLLAPFINYLGSLNGAVDVAELNSLLLWSMFL